MTDSLELTVEDIDQIVEAIENFVMGPTEDAELTAIWQPYIDKLLWLRAGIATKNAQWARDD